MEKREQRQLEIKGCVMQATDRGYNKGQSQNCPQLMETTPLQKLGCNSRERTLVSPAAENSCTIVSVPSPSDICSTCAATTDGKSLVLGAQSASTLHQSPKSSTQKPVNFFFLCLLKTTQSCKKRTLLY